MRIRIQSVPSNSTSSSINMAVRYNGTSVLCSISLMPLIRAEYSVFEYSKNNNGWIIYINPAFSEFEHLEEGLQYLNSKSEQFLPE